MHAFLMIRVEEIVAEGVMFSDGRVAIRWLVPEKPSSTVTWDSIQDAMEVHGHDGETQLAFASDIVWPPAGSYEHNHQWDTLMPENMDGPWYCVDCGAYESQNSTVEAEVKA